MTEEEEVEDRVESEAEARYMMPPVPEDVDVDPVLLALLHYAAFLDLADDDIVDPEAASDVLEHVGMYIQRLAPDELQALSGQLDRLADHGTDQGWPEWITGFVSDFLYSCGIGEDRDRAVARRNLRGRGRRGRASPEGAGR